MVDEKIIEAFHMMWDNFPGAVRLIHKNRMVLAVNNAARDRGFETGVPCFSIGAPEAHLGCLANAALSSNNGQVENSTGDKLRYWIPVKDCDDLYVHFQVIPSTIK